MIIILAIIVAILTFAGVGVMYRRATVIDVPNERSSHQVPTPGGGGLPLVLVVVLAGLVVPLLWGSQLQPDVGFYVYLLAAATIAAVGWVDDLKTLPARVRFGAQFGCALIVIAAVGFWRVIDLPFIGQLNLGWIGLPITLLWFIGLTNAYNFMDGIDGIAGGQAVVAGFGWAILGVLFDLPLIGFLGVLIGSASIGFLGHNWHPAKIFMGDVGSTFLGFTFATMPLLFNVRVSAEIAPKSFLLGILLVWPFLFDAILTFCRRLIAGENVFAAHRSHLYQRLVIQGKRHDIVTALYILLGLLGFVLQYIWLNFEQPAVLLFPLVWLGGAVGLVWYVTLAEQRATRA